MVLTHKTEFYPTEEQKQELEKYFGIRRFVFNSYLMNFKKLHKDLKLNKNKITSKDLSDYRTVLRNKYKHFVSIAPSQIVETSMDDFKMALNSLWKKGKAINLRKKKDSNTCRISRKNETNFKYTKDTKYLTIVRLGTIKMSEPIRYYEDKVSIMNPKTKQLEIRNESNIKAVTISKKYGKYFISITMSDCNPNNLQLTGNKIAFDWGIKTYLTGYDGNDYFEVDFDKRHVNYLNKNIARKSRSLSKHKYNSSNYFKAKTKLEKSYAKKVNYQEDFIKKLANELANSYDEIILEDLTTAFMFKSFNLAKKAAEGLFYKTKVIFYNKFIQSGKKILLVDKQFPSTQTCSCCGHIRTGSNKLKLSDRIYKCLICKHKQSRDENAAKNIYQYLNPVPFSKAKSI